MFAGGYLGAIVAGKSVDEAVEAGHKLGAMCVGQVGAWAACFCVRILMNRARVDWAPTQVPQSTNFLDVLNDGMNNEQLQNVSIYKQHTSTNRRAMGLYCKAKTQIH